VSPPVLGAPWASSSALKQMLASGDGEGANPVGDVGEDADPAGGGGERRRQRQTKAAGGGEGGPASVFFFCLPCFHPLLEAGYFASWRSLMYAVQNN
jgi:hypothetical protein